MHEWVEHPSTGQLTLVRRWLDVEVYIDLEDNPIFDLETRRADSVEDLINTIATFHGRTLYVQIDANDEEPGTVINDRFIKMMRRVFSPVPVHSVYRFSEFEWGRFFIEDERTENVYDLCFRLSEVIRDGPRFIATWIPETRKQLRQDGYWTGLAQIEMIEKPK
jgi:hypothetical protein